MAKVFDKDFKREPRDIKAGKTTFIVEIVRDADLGQSGSAQEHVRYYLYDRDHRELANFKGELYKGQSVQQKAILNNNGNYDFHISYGDIKVEKLKEARRVASLLLGVCYDDLRKKSTNGQMVIDPVANMQDFTWFQRVCLKFNKNYLVNVLHYTYNGEEQEPIDLDYRRVDVARARLEYMTLEKWPERGE